MARDGIVCHLSVTGIAPPRAARVRSLLEKRALHLLSANDPYTLDSVKVIVIGPDGRREHERERDVVFVFLSTRAVRETNGLR